MYGNSACSVADGRTRRQTREASAEVWNTCSYVCKVDVSWLSAFKMNTIEIPWCVKSYHYFKVKPNPGEVMQVRREYNNPVDSNAMSGEQVGRVPANLC